jgi:two-component system response regulator FlrC
MKDIPILFLSAGGDDGHRFAQALEAEGCRVSIYRLNENTNEVIRNGSWRLILIEEDLDQTWHRHLDAIPKGTPFIIVSKNGSVRRAAEAIHNGASDYVLQTSDLKVLIASMDKAILLAYHGDSNDDAKAAQSRKLITADKTMLKLLDTARRIAKSEATVLLQGDSGTGKEVLARFIHSNSARCQGPFKAINCAALPETLAESELFGYEKGAFTGASGRKIGKFEQAQNGTLLLDEISEMPITLQPKLLRVLQEKNVTRIGGHQSISVNARIVATTNRKLGQLAKEGSFRQDLYYRLRVIPLEIPPLKERRDDIPLLVNHFIEKYADPSQPKLPRFDSQSMDHLMRWHWPGNVRELENTIQRAILICGESLITKDCLLLDDDLREEKIEESAQLVGMTVKELEQKLIVQTLSHVNQNRTHASEMLGISIRTLRNKLREYRESRNSGLKQATG